MRPATFTDVAATNSTRFIVDGHAPYQLLELFMRSDDRATKFEATRVFVNVTRSLSASRFPESFAETSEKFVAAFTWMLVTGRQYPVLVNEAIIALALLATFGPSETRKFTRYLC